MKNLFADRRSKCKIGVALVLFSSVNSYLKQHCLASRTGLMKTVLIWGDGVSKNEESFIAKFLCNSKSTSFIVRLPWNTTKKHSVWHNWFSSTWPNLT